MGHIRHVSRVTENTLRELMSSNKDETAVHGCHCRSDVAVRMRKVLTIPRICIV